MGVEIHFGSIDNVNSFPVFLIGSPILWLRLSIKLDEILIHMVILQVSCYLTLHDSCNELYDTDTLLLV